MMMSKQMETIELQKSALRKQAEARVNAERAAQAQESRSPAPFSHAAGMTQPTGEDTGVTNAEGGMFMQRHGICVG